MTSYALGLLGLPGTGKSSTITELCSVDTGLTARYTEQFHIAGSRMTSYISRLFGGASHEFALACQVEALAQRVLLHRDAGPSVCIDEPIEAVLAHTMAMQKLGMFPQEQHDSWMLLYNVIRETLPQAHFLALLTCERQELQRRIMQRGRSRDHSVGDEYLSALDESLRSVAEMSNCAVIIIDTSKRTPRDVASAILSKMLA